MGGKPWHRWASVETLPYTILLVSTLICLLSPTDSITITSVYAGKKKFKTISLGIPFLPSLVKVRPNKLHLTFRSSSYKRRPKFKLEGSVPLKVPTILMPKQNPYAPEKVSNVNLNLHLGLEKDKAKDYAYAASTDQNQIEGASSQNLVLSIPPAQITQQTGQNPPPKSTSPVPPNIPKPASLPAPTVSVMGSSAPPPIPGFPPPPPPGMAIPPPPLPLLNTPMINTGYVPPPPPPMPIDPASSTSPQQEAMKYAPLPPMPGMSMLPPYYPLQATEQQVPFSNELPPAPPQIEVHQRTKRSLNLNQPYHHHIEPKPTRSMPHPPPSQYSTPYGMIPPFNRFLLSRPPPPQKPVEQFPRQKPYRKPELKPQGQFAATEPGYEDKKSQIPMKINIGEHYNPEQMYMDDSALPNFEGNEDNVSLIGHDKLDHPDIQPEAAESSSYQKYAYEPYPGPDDIRLDFKITGINGGAVVPKGYGRNIEQYHEQLKEMGAEALPPGLSGKQLHNYYLGHTFTEPLKEFHTSYRKMRPHLFKKVFGWKLPFEKVIKMKRFL